MFTKYRVHTPYQAAGAGRAEVSGRAGGAWLTKSLARNLGITPVAWLLGVVARAAARPLGPGSRGRSVLTARPPHGSDVGSGLRAAGCSSGFGGQNCISVWLVSF